MNIQSLVLITLSSVVMTACSSINPVSYNDTLVDILAESTEYYNHYALFAEETSLAYVDKIDDQRKITIENLQKQEVALNQIGAYDKDTTLLLQAQAYNQTLLDLLADQEATLLDLWVSVNNTPADQWNETTEQTFLDQQEILIATINDTITAAHNEFIQAQESFALLYRFDLDSSN